MLGNDLHVLYQFLSISLGCKKNQLNPTYETSYKDGHARGEGYLSDYAMVIGGLISLHRANFKGEYLKHAIKLAEIMAREFWDESESTFYETGSRHETLFARPRSMQDSSLPSGASAATLELLELSRITGNRQFERIVERSLRPMKDLVTRYPLGFGNWLNCLDFYLSTPEEIAVVGPRRHPDTLALKHVICGYWLPNTTITALDTDDPMPISLKATEGKEMVDERPTVYICRNYACLPPVTSPDTLREKLG